uniref:Adenylate kinase n=1 Tax=Hemiselmis tepida TaxID=464990 RepID=A0A7S0YXF2_9CRYP|mmetsp:Transcript_28039/g.70958  ORF Transcript_28039/g.70958 Transcript_28039/m.70958 type:complete len:715 (+) Transcript_28039:80-2224(+)|eukprot:CAMPEP_0174928420 /NCGR_PEP_ID=MMETSP1355-20121228/23356_1 /TAXON_ID=464990 /ORGANISM="Hemiselmis tepida, Strain CCMP443" /LENGTH=714 /DNA_ID=CAMNT_0016174579 /DNA_START=72 /DNA_END=2216 /DNA_ORIENTATION=+
MPPKKDDKAPPPAAGGGGKQLKIFIHELDGYLGNVLGDVAKKHAAEGEQPIICGSLIDPRNKPTWADEVVRGDDILGLKKALLASDVIVYDLTSSPKEATSALKILLKYDYAENPEDETEKVMIGVSSLLSWAGNSEPLVDGVDGAPPTSGELNILTTQNADERKAHPDYKAQVAVENLVVKKGNVRKDKLRTYVVWSGLAYGCGEGVLHSLFKCSWLGTHKVLPILGSGANKVPMIHVQDLAGVVLNVAKTRPADFSTIVAVDRGEATIGEVVKAISTVLQSGEVKNVGPDEYLEFMTQEKEPHINSVQLGLNVKMAFDRAEALGYGPESESWVSGNGFVANIDKVVEEYRKWRGVVPIRVLFYGPPATGMHPTEDGKVMLARDFAEEYQVNYINVPDLVEEFKAAPPFAEGGTDLGAKVAEATAEEGAEVPDELVTEMVQRKLQQPSCRNQGFVLENFPGTREAAEALFDVDTVPAEGEAPPEEEEAAVGEGQEPPPKKAPLPTTVFSLCAEEEFLLKRIAALGEEEAAAQGLTEEEFQAKMTAYNEANAPDEEGQPAGLVELYRQNQAKGCEQVVEIVVDNPLEFVQDKIRMSIGEPRNYDPNKARRDREAKAAADVARKEAEAAAKKAAEDEASRSEREQQAQLDADRLQKLQEEERKSLEVRSEPMRKYLMDNVLPTLTVGLQEVAKVRPNDPIDFLAEYLFNADPQLT